MDSLIYLSKPQVSVEKRLVKDILRIFVYGSEKDCVAKLFYIQSSSVELWTFSTTESLPRAQSAGPSRIYSVTPPELPWVAFGATEINLPICRTSTAWLLRNTNDMWGHFAVELCSNISRIFWQFCTDMKYKRFWWWVLVAKNITFGRVGK